LSFPLLMEWFSVSSLADVLSKIEGIMFSCECAFFFLHPCFRCLHNMPQILRLVNTFFGIFSYLDEISLMVLRTYHEIDSQLYNRYF
jgi:hypothetical protein